MKYYIIAGEASGDLHGSNLIKELRKLDQESMIRCWGGDKMQDAGAISVDEAKIMRLNVGLMPNEQRGLTADDKKDLRKIALDTTRPATERIYAILMLSG